MSEINASIETPLIARSEKLNNVRVYSAYKPGLLSRAMRSLKKAFSGCIIQKSYHPHDSVESLGNFDKSGFHHVEVDFAEVLEDENMAWGKPPSRRPGHRN